MEFHFEPDLPHQRAAMDAVLGLFKGQVARSDAFTLAVNTGMQLGLSLSTQETGYANRLTLDRATFLANVRRVQLLNGLPQATRLEPSPDFTLELETGTGKTYVYLRTVLELHRAYGFTKFVIVVPSIAIKEGVYKSLQMTEKHFRRELFDGIPYRYFVYDSSRLGDVRSFATSSQVQLMVVTVGAINKKDVNNLYKAQEALQDALPIELIRQTRPILIVDEPQSVDGRLEEGSGRKALKAMEPLFTLRYSATHVVKHEMIYRLNAVDAYEQKLVKQIAVASADVQAAYNTPYLKLLSVESKKGRVWAKVELDVQGAAGVRRQEKNVCDGDDLEQTTHRSLYADHRIGTLQAGKHPSLELFSPGVQQVLGPGESVGGIDPDNIHAQMIERTIRAHLEKELRLRPRGIKVLSLFFIDRVEHYRRSSAGGAELHPEKGKFARIFEERYTYLSGLPEFRSLFQGREVPLVSALHDGYFAIDKKGVWVEAKEEEEGSNAESRAQAERAFQLIMRDKERLLSFETPLSFIFSHSALKEGWDNPNVFQICALRDIGTERQRRQTIGRGLRLCVNQTGARVRERDVNTLTVVALEDYAAFAEGLQQELEQETGVVFGHVAPHAFALLVVQGASGEPEPLGAEASLKVVSQLKAEGLLTSSGKITDELKRHLLEGTLPLPEGLEPLREGIQTVLKRLSGRLVIQNANKGTQIRTRRAILDSPEFQALWEKIKYKTLYRISFDPEELIRKGAQALRHSFETRPVVRASLTWRTAELALSVSGVDATERAVSAPQSLSEGPIRYPDLLTELMDRTELTRKSIARIIQDSETMDAYLRNPQQYIQQAYEAIERVKTALIVEGITYQKLGEDQFYAQELFEQEELLGYLHNTLEAQKSVYERVRFDSDEGERVFAEALEHNDAVKVYAKLPAWFKVPTPLGFYNPDWAVLVEDQGRERLYFVLETKPGLFADDLRGREADKVRCGKAHFAALAEDRRVPQEAAEYRVVNSPETFLAIVQAAQERSP